MNGGCLPPRNKLQHIHVACLAGAVCETMTADHFNDPEHWRQQADEARAIARQLPNPEIQSRDDAGCCGL